MVSHKEVLKRLQDQKDEKAMGIGRIASGDNTSDIGTKPLKKDEHVKHREGLGVRRRYNLQVAVVTRLVCLRGARDTLP